MQDQCDALPVNLAKAKPNAFKGEKKHQDRVMLCRYMLSVEYYCFSA